MKGREGKREGKGKGEGGKGREGKGRERKEGRVKRKGRKGQ